MKRCAILLSAALVTVLFAEYWISDLGAQSAAGDAVAQILGLETEHNAAIAHGDVSTLDTMTSDDYTFITPRGFLVTKAQVLKALANGEFKYEYRQIQDVKIRVYGDAAVVTGRSLYTGQSQGKEQSGTFRYTRVYVRQNGRWLAVAWQATREDERRRSEGG
jgi:ketosteroid isomerase-like protein